MAALYTSVVTSVLEWIFADIKEFDNEEDFLDDLMELGSLLWTREDSKPCILGYAEKVVPLYYDQDFQRHFRLSRSTFDVLVHKASTWKELSLDRSCGGKVAIPVVNQLLITLWCLGTQETFRQLSDRFGVAESQCMVSYGKFVYVYHFICDTLQSNGLVDPKLYKSRMKCLLGITVSLSTHFLSLINCLCFYYLLIKT